MTTEKLSPIAKARLHFRNASKRAVFIYQRLVKNGAEKCLATWHNALRESWKATKALIAGVVTFAKKETGEITTRKIEVFSFAEPKDDIIRVTDLAKVAEAAKSTIISFHSYQVIFA